MGAVPTVALGATRRLREVNTGDVVDCAVGFDDAVERAVASGAVVAPAVKPLRALSFHCPTSELSPTEAGAVLAWAADGVEVCAEAWRAVLPVVEPVVDGCDDFEEPSSAQASPHVVMIAAPTRGLPPARPRDRCISMRSFFLLRLEKCCKKTACPEPLRLMIHLCVHTH